VSKKPGLPDTTAWREWAKNASPSLMELFEEGQLEVMRNIRSNYPSDCGPGHPQYLMLRRECVAGLDQLATNIQAENEGAMRALEDHDQED